MNIYASVSRQTHGHVIHLLPPSYIRLIGYVWTQELSTWHSRISVSLDVEWAGWKEAIQS